MSEQPHYKPVFPQRLPQDHTRIRKQILLGLRLRKRIAHRTFASLQETGTRLRKIPLSDWINHDEKALTMIHSRLVRRLPVTPAQRRALEQNAVRFGLARRLKNMDFFSFSISPAFLTTTCKSFQQIIPFLSRLAATRQEKSLAKKEVADLARISKALEEVRAKLPNPLDERETILWKKWSAQSSFALLPRDLEKLASDMEFYLLGENRENFNLLHMELDETWKHFLALRKR